MIVQAKKPTDLMLKEALHIQMTPAEERFNCDRGLELPEYWITALKKLRGGASYRLLLASSHVNSLVCMIISSGYFRTRLTFALKTSRASSQSVGKVSKFQAGYRDLFFFISCRIWLRSYPFITIKLASTESCHKYKPPYAVLKTAKRQLWRTI